MEALAYKADIPELEKKIDQDEEWLTIQIGEKKKKIRFHDYSEIYNIPGLYEKIFYEYLKCNSPKTVSNMLSQVLKKEEYNPENLRILDFGAGNGMVGEVIRKKGCDLLVGVDILDEARDATFRDRPKVYDNYYVIDMNEPEEDQLERLGEYRFNTLITVAALGFGDIPPRAFINAFNLVEDGGLIAFNIKDRFLTKDDDTGYKEIVEHLIRESFTTIKTKLYCHRLSISGEELNYLAIVGKKLKSVNLKEIDDRLLQKVLVC